MLEREVAVKGLREDLDTPLVRARLLLEARVTGRLEHPNVVPVHLVTEDDEGRPRIVLKRIEGRSWRELLDERPPDGRDLAEHVRILGQVCQAIRFAHSRGVLHRDLKPENVMVGDFGEVYVVDWGIALALHERTGVRACRSRERPARSSARCRTWRPRWRRGWRGVRRHDRRLPARRVASRGVGGGAAARRQRARASASSRVPLAAADVFGRGADRARPARDESDGA
ncbi:MAG: protein kinase [Sandaracinus sp.]|nr:protein kinase [Sandaracinus sp.]